MKDHKLKIRQLDKQLKPVIKLFKNNNRCNNWFQIIRDALGMSNRYLASKLNITPGRVTQLQEAEKDGSITLRNLHKLASSLECELVYSFIPRESLATTIEKKAKEIVREQISRVSHSMYLEQQGTSQEELNAQYEELLNDLISSHPKNLWKSKKIE